MTENFSYDVEGRVSDYTQTVDYRSNYPMTVSYLYDTLDRVTDMRYPAAYGLPNDPRKLIQNSYDVAGRLSSFKVDGTQVAGNIVYNAADQTTSIKIGAAGANQVTEEYTFDPLTGLLTNQKVQNSSQTLLDLTYNYSRNNAVGSLNGKTGHLTKIVNNLDNNKNREYEFDALGRLTKAMGGTNGSLWQQNYSYDRYGNRTNVTASGVAADNSPIPLDGLPNLTYNSTNNRVTTTGFDYDSAGNQTSGFDQNGTAIKFEYDAANRLKVVKKQSDGTTLQAFQYGSTNARLMDTDYQYGYTKIFASTGGTTLSEYTEFTGAIPTWTKSYTYLSGSQLSTVEPNGAGGEITEYNHPDRLGIRTITNQATGTNFEQNTLPFGTALNAESSGSQSKRFTSYERSPRTGFDYAVNRTYDSKQGRFTQVDPIGMSATSLGSPQSLNLYTYCGNDPVNHTDANGLFFGSLFKWISKAFKVFNKILKWVVIAVAVIAVAIAIFQSGGAALGFLQYMLGIVGKMMGVSIKMSPIIMNYGFVSVQVGTVASLSISVVGQIAAGLYAVGSIATNFAQNKQPRKKEDTTLCPLTAEQILTFKGIFEAAAIFQKELKEASGRWKEVGGWIFDKKGSKSVKFVIFLDPRNTVIETYGLDEPLKNKDAAALLKKGWKIIATLHTHPDFAPANQVDESIAIDRKTPGILVRPDGSAISQGPNRGILGIGIPKGCEGGGSK